MRLGRRCGELDAAGGGQPNRRQIDEIEDLQELFSNAFALEEVVAAVRQEIRTYTQHHCI